MTAVHFGAGNIGRGFIGLLLHNAGHHVTFVDVDGDLIDRINATESYRVVETGHGAVTHTVSNFSGLNSSADPDAVVAAVASADVVTTAVGPRVLPFIAPLIAKGLVARDSAHPVAIMACENALGATDVLKEAVSALVSADVMERGVFANTAVDRIVPIQHDSGGLDVLVESFCEWVIDRSPFGGLAPTIAGAKFVDNLDPYIERKLFTVNTGHASIAYLGKRHGAGTIAEALLIPAVLDAVTAVLAETTDMLVARHGIDRTEQQQYAHQTLTRFSNSDLEDDVDRVGRQPLRKLSRHERLIEPAAALAEAGQPPVALVGVIGAAFDFDVKDDTESVELQGMREALAPTDLCTKVCGLESTHPLFSQIVDEITRVR